MTIQLWLFGILLVGTIFDNTFQWYTQVETYPLEALVGPADFNRYGREYERRLTVALYIPYTITMLANAILIFSRPAGLSAWLFVACFLLNLSILPISLLIAVPVHRQIEAAGFASPENVRKLLRINGLRLGVATLSSLIVLGMVFTLIVSR